MPHAQFTHDERIALAQLLWAGKKQVAIAERLGKDPGAISREIERNKDEDGVYRSASAHKKAMARRTKAKEPANKIHHDRKLRRHIVRKIKHYWSPEQIAGRLAYLKKKTLVSHETIYKFIYEDRPDLKKYLRCRKGKYQRKRGTKVREGMRDAGKIRRIGERPLIVEKRKRIGDWEGDTVIDRTKKQRIITHVDRTSGLGARTKTGTVFSASSIQRKVLLLQ